MLGQGRADLKELLSFIGLDEYNIWDIVKKTHRTDYDNLLWIKWELDMGGCETKMKEVNLEKDFIMFKGSTSKGTQVKYFYDGRWYKRA